jgi:lipopolysaccharide transport system ATP-binding protein
MTGSAKGSLHVADLGKAYRFYPSRWARLGEWLVPGKCRHELHWVLRHIGFSVAPGESVGVIGRNGAGKSTLLKLITGTTQPSEGQVTVTGRIAALLELGMGFHPEFTGRENVFMTGQLSGLSAPEIASAMPQIESFAEIGRYIDEPLRTYSSGMQVRLAFSVATAFRPDILIVDEALAVGDLYFQHKCYARIRQFRAEGMTLLFVSHDPGAIKSLCDRAILLDAGGIRADDRPDDVLDYYNALIAAQENAEVTAPDRAPSPGAGVRSGDRRAALLDVALFADEQPAKVVRVGQAVRLSIRFRKHVDVGDLTVGFLIRDRLGNDVYGTNSWLLGDEKLRSVPVGAVACVDCRIPALNLGPGSYSVTVALHSNVTHLEDNYDWWDKALVFEVVRGTELFFVGVAHLPGVEATVSVDR